MRLDRLGLPFVLSASVLLASAVGCGEKAADDTATGGTNSAGGKPATGGGAGTGTGGSAGTAAMTAGKGGTGGSVGGSAGTGAGATGGTGGSAGGAGGTGGSTAGSGGSSGGGASGAGGAGAAGGAGGSGGVATGGTAGTGAGAGGAAGMSMGGASGSGTAGMSGSAGAAQTSCTNPTDFTGWATGKGPADIGPLAVTNFKSHTGDDYGGAGYALTFTWFGALVFSHTTNDTANNTALITGFEPYATGSKTVSNTSTSTVDDRAFGTLPLEIYMQNQDARCKTLGLARADMQWMNTTSDGITKDARYWADDMYMITGLQVRAYRATKDMTYLDRSAKTMIAYLAALQQADGMFWHTKQSKAYWGRANGWVASGMTELLLDLPTGTQRDQIMAGYKKMMDGLLTVQITGGADDGGWRQVLDVSTASVETSCTAMFTFALVTGVRNGWLTDPKYAAAAKRGWVLLGNHANGQGQLDKVCPGTGQADAGTLQSQQQFYLDRPLGTNDMHGQAPLLWAAYALLRKDCPGVR
jgi:unsaturated rhamnogalacturonyl hydrolase